MNFCAILHIVDVELNQRVRPEHLRFVAEQYNRGKVKLAGPFADGSGGMVVYQNVTAEEAGVLARQDPAISSGARQLTLIEWNLLDLDSLA